MIIPFVFIKHFCMKARSQTTETSLDVDIMFETGWLGRRIDAYEDTSIVHDVEVAGFIFAK